MATSVQQHAPKRGVMPLPCSPRTLLVVALGGLVVFYLVMQLLSKHFTSVAGQVELDVKNGKISINTHGEKADLIEVITQLFADEEKSRVTRALLRDLQGLYTSDDPSLAAALEQLPPDHPVSRALRELVKQTKGPFGGIPRHVIIAVSSDTTLTGMIAASCTDSDFQGESLLMRSASSIITLNVSSPPFLCPHPPEEPLVRVSRETYQALFGAVSPHEQTVGVSVYPFQPVAFVPN
jgi:hypothetical protein